MASEPLSGKIIFIHHEKEYATIEYMVNGRKKNVNANISVKEQEKLKAEKIIKKIHQYHVGDEVSFILTQSARGDKMIADCVEFKYNNALDNLINRSTVENRLVGYLKKVDDHYFVKETGSYIFFPLVLSPWEKKPLDTHLNEPVFFKLNHSGKPDKATAALYKSVYIPEYLAAQRFFKDKTIIDATIYKITPHGIFVHVVGDKIQAKIPVPDAKKDNETEEILKVGDSIKLIISYLSSAKIIVQRVH